MQGMQAQNMMWGPTFVTIGMFVANIFVNLGLIKMYGFTGAAYAQSVSRIALLLFLIGGSPLPEGLSKDGANAFPDPILVTLLASESSTGPGRQQFQCSAPDDGNSARSYR